MSDTPNGSANRKHDRTAYMLSMLLTLGYFGLLFAAFTLHIPEESQRIVDMMIGNYTIVWTGSMAYFFNTTAGSAKKTDLIAKSGPVHPD